MGRTDSTYDPLTNTQAQTKLHTKENFCLVSLRIHFCLNFLTLSSFWFDFPNCTKAPALGDGSKQQSTTIPKDSIFSLSLSLFPVVFLSSQLDAGVEF